MSVAVYIGSTDRTAQIRAADAFQIDWRRAVVANAGFVAQSLDGSWTPAVFDAIRVEIDGLPIFRGTIDEVSTGRPDMSLALLTHEIKAMGQENSLRKRILTNANYSRTPVTVSAAGDSLTIMGATNDFALGDAVKVRSDGTLAGGLSASTVYYVRALSSTNVQLSTSPSGSIVDITSAGSGQHHLYWCAGSIVRRIIPAGEGISAGTIRDGAGMEVFSTEYTSCFDAMEQLTSASSGYVWYIDPAAQTLNFVPIAEFAAPFSISETSPEVLRRPGRPGIDFRKTRERYANRVFLLPDEKLRALSLNTITGNGSARSFSVLFPIKSVLSISRGGLGQTVGDYGDTSAQWTFDAHTKYVYHNPSETVLASGETVSIQYYGLGTLAREADSSVEQSLHGLYEKAVTGAATTYGDADAAAAAELASSQVVGIVASYETMTHGVRPAQGQTISFPSCGIASQVFAVESVQATWNKAIDFSYRVEAHGGTRIPGFAEMIRSFLGSTASSGSAVGGVSGGGGGTTETARSHLVTLSLGNYSVDSPSGFGPDVAGRLLWLLIGQDGAGGWIPSFSADFATSIEIDRAAGVIARTLWISEPYDSKWHLVTSAIS